MSNIEVLSAVHGIAPRSDELLKLGSDVERGRAERANYDERLAKEEADWLTLQREAGIDYQEAGKLRWQDNLRPIVKASEGFASAIDTAPVTRWFETNTFYRKPSITGQLQFHPAVFEANVGSPEPFFSILAPYSFAHLCENRAPNLDPIQNVLGLYSQIFEYLVSESVELVLLKEFVPSRVDSVLPSLRLAVDLELAHQDLKVIQSYPRKPEVSTFNQHSESGTSITHSERWRQVIDASTTVKDQLDVAQQLASSPDFGDRRRLVLSHGVDFEYLPLTYAQEKVKRLGEFAAQVRHRVEVAA